MEEESNAKPKAEEPMHCWLVHVDGSSNAASSEAELILTSPEGVIAEYVLYASDLKLQTMRLNMRP